MVFYRKPRKVYCQPTKESIWYNLPLHTHDEDHFHPFQILKLASGTHTEWILNREKKHKKNYRKVTKKFLQRQNINSQINSRYTPATNFKKGTYVLIPNLTTQKGISKKLQPLRKGSYQIIDKPTDVTYKLKDLKKKFNIETILYLINRKSTHFENLHNYTLLQYLKLFKIAQSKIKLKALICSPSKKN